MRLACAILAAASAGVRGQPADPISDRLRYEIAAAQRDYVIAKQQYDQAALAVRTKLGEAEKACGERRFDMQTFHCAEAGK